MVDETILEAAFSDLSVRNADISFGDLRIAVVAYFAALPAPSQDRVEEETRVLVKVMADALSDRTSTVSAQHMVEALMGLEAAGYRIVTSTKAQVEEA